MVIVVWGREVKRFPSKDKIYRYVEAAEIRNMIVVIVVVIEEEIKRARALQIAPLLMANL